MKFLRAMMILGLLAVGLMAAGFQGGCLTIAWKGTEAGANAVAAQEKPGQGPVLTAVEEGAKKTHDAMKKVDKAEEDALQKAKDAVTK